MTAAEGFAEAMAIDGVVEAAVRVALPASDRKASDHQTLALEILVHPATGAPATGDRAAEDLAADRADSSASIAIRPTTQRLTERRSRLAKSSTC